MILTAGPHITDREVQYVIDAVKNGWNENWNYYIERFEKEFAKYVGVKHAMTTSGGTWAFLLACEACGIGKGDEVIFPDLGYFSITDVLHRLGAKIVFVDVDPITWCIDPQQVKVKINKNTKAICSVNMYGNVFDEEAVVDLAKEHNLFFIEDSCPAVGSRYKNKHTGTFGDFGAFSFQGAKILSAGLGGMLVTNNDELFSRAQYLNRQGESYTGKFWQTEHGYNFAMTNMQCAMALGQLEHIEDMVEKKRQINQWYRDRLPGVIFQNEPEESRSNYWMTSILVKDRNMVRSYLKNKGIDTRPVFWPISKFPMYKEQRTTCAHHIGLNGINLPSGVMLREDNIEYICNKLWEII